MSRSQQVALHGKDNRISGVDPIPPGRWEYAGVGDAANFQNDWVNAGGGLQTFRYRRTNENQTEIQGFIRDGTANPVINLPDPYRPVETQHAVGSNADLTLIIWELTPAGDLNVYETSSGGVGPATAGSGLGESAGVLSVNVDNSTIEINADTLRVKADGITASQIAANAVTESEISLSDVTGDNVTSSAHGFAPKAPADSTKFLDGSATPAWDTVKDSDLSTSDITTNDVSTTKHGFTPKAPNDAAKFLRGDATWATIGGTGTALVSSDPIWDAKGDLAAATGADAATRLAVGANDTVLTADSAESTGMKWAAIPAPLLELVYRYTVTGSVKASIDTGVDSPDAGTNDWANGDILEIFIYARCDNAATTQTVSLTFNNDTSAVYDRTFLNNTNTTVTGNNSMAQTSGILGVAGDNASTGTFTTLCLWMHNYTGTVGNKQMNTLGGTLGQTAATATITNQNFTWRPASPAAVSRLKIIPTSGNFKIGTQLLIYKRRNA